MSGFESLFAVNLTGGTRAFLTLIGSMERPVLSRLYAISQHTEAEHHRSEV